MTFLADISKSSLVFKMYRFFYGWRVQIYFHEACINMQIYCLETILEQLWLKNLLDVSLNVLAFFALISRFFDGRFILKSALF